MHDDSPAPTVLLLLCCAAAPATGWPLASHRSGCEKPSDEVSHARPSVGILSRGTDLHTNRADAMQILFVPYFFFFFYLTAISTDSGGGSPLNLFASFRIFSIIHAGGILENGVGFPAYVYPYGRAQEIFSAWGSRWYFGFRPRQVNY